MFSHLNVHSIYSKMRGVVSPQELVRVARSKQMKYLALTEVNGLYGFIRFVQAAREQGILPIAGSNIITNRDEVVLLAETQKGYENLCHVISAVHNDPDVKIDNLLKPHKNGLFVLSHKAETIKSCLTVVPKTQLFVELRPGMPEAAAHKLAKNYGLEMVVTGDVYFLHPQQAKPHKLLRAIDENTTLPQLEANQYKNENHFFQSEKDLIRMFPNSLEAINNAQYLAERCKTDWNFISAIFPEQSLKKTHKANKQLRKIVYEGAKIRYADLSETVKKRLDYELDIIIQKGFAPYFLVVANIVQQTKATIGRGSGAASVVSYCLFITQVDPIKYNLRFERFIHPERVDMPDIDVDFPWDERDDVLNYVFEKYGLQRTAMVSSQVFLQPRSAIRETAKVYGLSNEEIKTITKRIGYSRSGKDLLKWISTDPRFKNADLNSTLMEIIGQSEKILGAFRVSSVHPGGVIIVPDEIRRYVPVLMATKGVQIVEWEKDQVEDSGLVKIDLLGNRSLAVVRDTIKQIDQAENDFMDYHKIQPIGDLKTTAVMKSGRTMGVFYIESPATRLLLKKAKAVDFEHVVIYSSIIRPAANRYINIMLERIHGKPWKLLHPDLTCLAESYGIMVYEEQVSAVARDISGFSYAEADFLRKVIRNSSLAGVLSQWKKKFIENAVVRGYSRSLATNLWVMMQSFSGYSFCKPHSASYAMLSFTCAYLKAHHTAEFLASVVTNQGGFYSAYAYLSEARRWGIEILLPDINISQNGYIGKNKQIHMGFMSIKDLQGKAVDEILEARKSGPFKSLEDFLLRVELDLSDAMALTKAFCFTSLAPELSYRQIALNMTYFYQQEDKQLPKKISSLLPAKKITWAEKRQLEIESFGFPVSEHPLKRYLALLQGRVKKAKHIPEYEEQSIYLAGVFITRKVTSTKKEEPMEFVTFEDETDIYECVMFPKVYKKYSDLFNWETLFIIQGTVEKSFDVHTLTIERLFSLKRVVEKLKTSQSRAAENMHVSISNFKQPVDYN